MGRGGGEDSLGYARWMKRERERVAEWEQGKEKGGKGNPVFLLALVRAVESLRNRREPDKLAAKQAAISRNDGTRKPGVSTPRSHGKLHRVENYCTRLKILATKIQRLSNESIN